MTDHYSDILTELEGAQLDFYNHVLRDKCGVMPPTLALQMRSERENDLRLTYMTQVFELRLIHNSILQQVYSIARAYCRPEHIAEQVATITTRLQKWYEALPQHDHFAQSMETLTSADLRPDSRVSKLVNSCRIDTYTSSAPHSCTLPCLPFLSEQTDLLLCHTSRPRGCCSRTET